MTEIGQEPAEISSRQLGQQPLHGVDVRVGHDHREVPLHGDALGNLRFCVMTCQDYADRGHPDGHEIYPSMASLKPQFTCLTGDLVYYDKDQGDAVAVTERLARYHWERMFSLPRLMEFNSNHAT